MTEITPLKSYIPGELNIERLDYEEARKRKRGMQDSELKHYYDDEVHVVDVDEAQDGYNLKIPDFIIEKRPNRLPNELTYGILLDDLGSGAEMLYMRVDDEGDLRYGMPFYRDYGQLKDVKRNSFPDILDYAETTGEAYGPLYDTGIIHEDLIGMFTAGEWNRTPKLRNILFAGSADHAVIIDAEDARFEDRPSMKGHSNHIQEMNPETRDDEYNAVVHALVIDTLRSLDHIHELAEMPIHKTHVMSPDPDSGLDFVDLQKLAESPVSNPDVNSMIREIEDRFEQGFHKGQIKTGEFIRNMNDSVIETDISTSGPIQDAARERLDSEIAPEVEKWLSDLNIDDNDYSGPSLSGL